MNRIGIASVLFIVSSMFSWVAEATETYTFDAEHSYVAWQVSHFGFSKPSGKWMVKGEIQFDEATPALSHVRATIPMADLETGLPSLNDHLKGMLFFDVKQYPQSKFVSRKIHLLGKDKATLEGDLTLHGITKPVVLHVTLNKKGSNPMTMKDTLGFSATATIKRSDFDITTLLPGIGDTVDIEIEVEAYRSL